MREMTFIPQLQKFLLTNKRIVTVRMYKMPTDYIWVPGVGKCYRTYKGEVKAEDLALVIGTSGFETLGHWLAKINQFITKGNPWYLYEVVLVKEEPDEEK